MPNCQQRNVAALYGCAIELFCHSCSRIRNGFPFCLPINGTLYKDSGIGALYREPIVPFQYLLPYVDLQFGSKARCQLDLAKFLAQYHR